MSKPVAVITGASSGIGKACAQVFAANGFTVVISARNKEKLDLVAKEIRDNGQDVLEVLADVSREEDCRNLIEETTRHYQRIDVLINNAGLSMRALFEDTSLDVLRKLM